LKERDAEECEDIKKSDGEHGFSLKGLENAIYTSTQRIQKQTTWRYQGYQRLM
jgi:hypothetical protein